MTRIYKGGVEMKGIPLQNVGLEYMGEWRDRIVQELSI